MAQYSLFVSEFGDTEVTIQPSAGSYGGPQETVEVYSNSKLEDLVATPLYQNAVGLTLIQVSFTPQSYKFPVGCQSLKLDRCLVPGAFQFPQQLRYLMIKSMNLEFPLVCSPPIESISLENCLLLDIPVIPETVRSLQLNLMTIAGEFMDHLPALPNGLEILEAETNGLTVLPPLPPNLTTLSVSENLLTELPALPSTLRYLSAHTNRLTELPALPATLEHLNVHTNLLQSLPLPLPPKLRITEEGLMNNPWNRLFTWVFNRVIELYQKLGWGQSEYVQQQLRQELKVELEKANIRQKGRNVAAAKLLNTTVPGDPLGSIIGFLSGKSGTQKQQTLKLREELSRPYGGPGVGGRRTRSKGRKGKRSTKR